MSYTFPDRVNRLPKGSRFLEDLKEFERRGEFQIIRYQYWGNPIGIGALSYFDGYCYLVIQNKSLYPLAIRRYLLGHTHTRCDKLFLSSNKLEVLIQDRWNIEYTIQHIGVEEYMSHFRREIKKVNKEARLEVLSKLNT